MHLMTWRGLCAHPFLRLFPTPRGVLVSSAAPVIGNDERAGRLHGIGLVNTLQGFVVSHGMIDIGIFQQTRTCTWQMEILLVRGMGRIPATKTMGWNCHRRRSRSQPHDLLGTTQNHRAQGIQCHANGYPGTPQQTHHRDQQQGNPPDDSKEHHHRAADCLANQAT